MKRGSLPRRLLNVGRVAGRRGESGEVRFAALLLATAILAVGLCAMVAVHAGYGGKFDRAANRVPVEAAKGEATVLVAYTSDELVDSRTFDVIIVSPLESDAPVPPGVERWPGRVRC